MGPRLRGDDGQVLLYGIANRSVLPPPHMSTAAKPIAARPRDAAIALFVDLEFALARAELRRAAPVQRPVLDADGAVFGIDRFGETEHLLRLAGTSGCRHLPGSIRYQPRL